MTPKQIARLRQTFSPCANQRINAAVMTSACMWRGPFPEWSNAVLAAEELAVIVEAFHLARALRQTPR